MARGFLISEGLRDKIHQTIARVDGTPYGGRATSVTPRLENIATAGGEVFRVATYTGAWSIGSLKTVTFKYQTATPNTASVTNLFFPVTGTAAGDRDCAIAKEGTAWYLIDVKLATATAVFVGATQSTSVMTDVTLSASLNTSACTISIGKTLVTTSVTIVSSTFTSTFLRVDG